jgi:hypothetical protein
MAMGDIVLFEDEVNPVMSAALDYGLAVTALHNHFLFDKAKVYFMHVASMGRAEDIGTGVKARMDTVKSVRHEPAAPREASGRTPISGPSRIDAAELDRAFGVKGKTQDDMYKATFGRNVTSAMCNGCSIGSAMGINTWASPSTTASSSPPANLSCGHCAAAESTSSPSTRIRWVKVRESCFPITGGAALRRTSRRSSRAAWTKPPGSAQRTEGAVRAAVGIGR